MKKYPAKNFEHAVVAVDVVILSMINKKLNALLLKLNEEPFVGKWALPGGLVKQGENLEEAVKRHLKTKAGVENIYFEQLYTFGEPNRDPNGWVVSVSYLALVNRSKVEPKTPERYEEINWHDVNNLPEMAYDHTEIIRTGVERLRSKITYTNIVYSLMNPEFTLTELQKVYEAILGKKLDKRNFRKKILQLELVTGTGKMRKGRPSRPAELFRFTSKESKIVEVL